MALELGSLDDGFDDGFDHVRTALRLPGPGCLHGPGLQRGVVPFVRWANVFLRPTNLLSHGVRNRSDDDLPADHLPRPVQRLPRDVLSGGDELRAAGSNGALYDVPGGLVQRVYSGLPDGRNGHLQLPFLWHWRDHDTGAELFDSADRPRHADPHAFDDPEYDDSQNVREQVARDAAQADSRRGHREQTRDGADLDRAGRPVDLAADSSDRVLPGDLAPDRRPAG